MEPRRCDDAGGRNFHDRGNARTAGRTAVVLRGGVAKSGVAAAVLAGLASFGGVAAAAPPSDTTTRAENFGCVLVTEAGATVRTSGTRDPQGPDVYVAVWAPGTDPDGPPTLQSDESRDTDEVTWNDGVVSGAIPMVDSATGQVVGDADFSAQMTATGPAETTTERGSAREPHNQRVHYTRVEQPTTGAARIVLPEGDAFVLSDCVGDITTTRSWWTMPEAWVYRADPAVFFHCEATHPSGASLWLRVEAGAESAVMLERIPPRGGDDPSIQGFGMDVNTTHTSVTATVPLETLPDFEPAGEAVLEAPLRRTGHRRFVLGHQTGKKTFTIEELAVDGTVSFPDGIVFALAGCVGERNTSHEIVTDPAGPKPGGRAPLNDTPDNAAALVAGRPRTDHSKGAAHAAEVPLWCYEDEPFPEQATGKTLWYSVEGTGDAMTVDTAGSSFNTVVGVYARQGDELVEIACVDDLFGGTLQARATFDTDPGVVYLVQVGGFAGQFGVVRMGVS